MTTRFGLKSRLVLVSILLCLASLVPVVRAQTTCTGDIATCQGQPTTMPQNTQQSGYGAPAPAYGNNTGYSTATPGYGSTTPSYGATTPAYGTSGYGSSSYGSSSGYGSSGYGNGSSSVPAVQGAPASSLGQRSGGAYGASNSGYGQQPSAYGAATGAGAYQAAPQTAAGPCKARLLDDRSTIALVDSGGDRKHIALGQDHVQQLFNSPDGAWTVAIFKVRGRPQYGALVIDLNGCAQSGAADLADAADTALFNSNDVALTLKGGASQSLALKPVQP